MQLSILIVDDEHLSRSYIHDVVLEVYPSAIVYEAESAEEAIPVLGQESIDILFTDIRMPKINGFGLLKSVSHRNFDLIFTTAYSQYAIQAIKEGASDYLLKPIKKTQLKETLEKVVKKRREEQKHTNTSSIDYLDLKLALGHQEGIKYISLKEIVYLEANSSYTTIFLSSGEKVTTSKAINKFESALSQHWFFRIHKSHIINIFHFKEYISKDGDIALMDNGHKLHISRYRLNDFLKIADHSSGQLKL